MAMVLYVPPRLHCISLFQWSIHWHLCVLVDRKVPMVLQATDEPYFFMRFVLIASCAHAP